MEKYIEAAASSRVFEGLDPEQCKKIITCSGGYTRRYGDGEIILSAGEPVPAFGIIVAGAIEAARQTASGRRVILARMKPADMFGEVLACSAERKSPVTVTSAGETTVLYISYDRLSACCDGACGFHVHVIRNLLKILADKYFQQTSRINCLTAGSLREKLAGYLLGLAESQSGPVLRAGLDREALAQYLNADRSALSRELSRMKRDGLLDYYRDSFRILDVKALQNCV